MPPVPPPRVLVLFFFLFFFFGFEHRDGAVDRSDVTAVIGSLRRPADHRAGSAAVDDLDRRTMGAYLAIVAVVIVVARRRQANEPADFDPHIAAQARGGRRERNTAGIVVICPLYTSDAADDSLRVALGGPGRIEKKRRR